MAVSPVLAASKIFLYYERLVKSRFVSVVFFFAQFLTQGIWLHFAIFHLSSF